MDRRPLLLRPVLWFTLAEPCLCSWFKHWRRSLATNRLALPCRRLWQRGWVEKDLSKCSWLQVERFFLQVLSPHQTTLTTILTWFTRQKAFKWKVVRYWGWSSPTLMFGLVVISPPAHATMSKSSMGMGQPWWTTAVATPHLIHLIPVTSCHQLSLPAVTGWKFSSTQMEEMQRLVGV